MALGEPSKALSQMLFTRYSGIASQWLVPLVVYCIRSTFSRYGA